MPTSEQSPLVAAQASPGRLFRRFHAGAEAGGRGKRRHRDRLLDPEGGRAIAVRTISPSRKTRRTSSRLTNSSIICSSRRSRRRTPITSPTPTPFIRANSSTRRSSTTAPSIRMPRPWRIFYQYRPRSEDAAADQSPVDAHQNLKVMGRSLIHSELASGARTSSSTTELRISSRRANARATVAPFITR
jgi:hypothetical protein